MKVLVLSGATYGDPARRKVLDHVARGGVVVTLALPRIVQHPFLPPGKYRTLRGPHLVSVW
mgnify:CR=1 FL=1